MKKTTKKKFDSKLKYKCNKIKLLEKHLNKMLKLYHYDEEKAELPIKFIEKNIKHWKAPFQGPMILEHWQKELLIRPIFGFYHKDKEGKPTDKRVVRETFFLIPRKNAKTALCSAILIYFFAMEGGESAQELYIGASKRDQAMISFNDCKAYITNNEVLSKHMQCYYNRIDFPAKKSVIKPLAGNATKGSGLNTSCFFGDEIHEMPNSDLINIIRTSQGARHNPLILLASTAGANKIGPCWELYDYGNEILNQRVEDYSFLPVIFEVDESDYFSEDAYKMSNPNLSISISEEFLKKELKKAKDQPSYAAAYQRFYLNRWTSIKEEKWFTAQQIEDNYDDSINIEDYYGKEAYAGLDLGQTNDLTALSIVIPHEGRLITKNYYWLPEEVIPERVMQQKVPYDQWQQKGWIETTAGDVIDTRFVSQRIVDICSKFRIKHFSFDPKFAYDISPVLMDEGIVVSEFRQNPATYTYSCLELEKYMLQKKLVISDRITEWCFQNVKLFINFDGKRKPHKDYRDYKEKNDGVCAMLFAIEAMRRANEDQGNDVNNLEEISDSDIKNIQKYFMGF